MNQRFFESALMKVVFETEHGMVGAGRDLRIVNPLFHIFLLYKMQINSSRLTSHFFPSCRSPLVGRRLHPRLCCVTVRLNPTPQCGAAHDRNNCPRSSCPDRDFSDWDVQQPGATALQLDINIGPGRITEHAQLHQAVVHPNQKNHDQDKKNEDNYSCHEQLSSVERSEERGEEK